MTVKKTAGRPATGSDKPISIRIDGDTVDKLDKIAEKEREKTGYKIDRSDIIRRAVKIYVESWKD